MSHLTTYKNQSLVNCERARLGKALGELGITLDYDNRTIKNQWIEETVDAAFVHDGKRIAVGINFKQNAEGQEEVVVAGDFWGTGLNQADLTNKLAQVYQKYTVIDKCAEQNWWIDNENDITENENGDIVIQAYRYV